MDLNGIFKCGGKRARHLAALAVVAASFAGVAQAGPLALLPGGSKGDWTITLGAEGRVLPSFEGSDRYMFRPLPLFDISDADSPPIFHSPRDGFGFSVLDNPKFRVGPAVKVRFGRKESNDSALRGLGDVNIAFEAGAFVEYWPVAWLRTRAELRQGFGGHHGIVSDLTADVVAPVTDRLTLSGGPRLTLASAKTEQPYFGVTAAQSLASGLPVYDTGGGVHAYGAGVQARFKYTPQWTTYVFMEYDRLAGPVANSPLVLTLGSRNQVQTGIGLTYSFNMKPLW